MQEVLQKAEVLIEALQQPNIEEYINAHYQGVVEVYKGDN